MPTHRPDFPSRLARPALILLIATAGAAPGRTDGPPQPDKPKTPPAVAAVPADPGFSALLVDGSEVSGRIIQVDQSRGVTLAGPGGAEQTVAIDRLVKLTRDGASAPSTLGRGVVLLPQGDRLANGMIGASTDTALALQSFSIGRVAVPLDALVGIMLEPPSDVDAATLLEAKIRTEPHDAERLWLANGDRLDGLFGGMTDKQVLFQPPTGQVSLSREGVVAVGFNPERAVEQPPRGPYFEWLLLDGSRIGLSPARIDRGQVIGRTRFNAEVRFPIGEVSRIRVLEANVTYLADRAADKVVYEAYLGPTRPYRRDASVVGSPLRLGGQLFDRGLGTQSRTLLAYRLDPRAKRFQATIGLDDAAGPLGNVVFKVLVDGKPRYESPTMGYGDPPKRVDIDIDGGKVLILITEFGERGDVQDSGDWAEARVVR